MTNKIELSLDIAMNNLGWVCFENETPIQCGVIKAEVPADLRCLKGTQKLSVREEKTILIEKYIDGLCSVIDEYKPVRIVGEATPGGAKSASAAVALNVSFSTALTVCRLRGIKYSWCSPNNVKMASVGNLKATKEQIMDWAVEHSGGDLPSDKKIKLIKITKGKRAGSEDRRLTYCFLGQWIPGGSFEHIADACGAYEAIRRNLHIKRRPVKYVNKPKGMRK